MCKTNSSRNVIMLLVLRCEICALLLLVTLLSTVIGSQYQHRNYIKINDTCKLANNRIGKCIPFDKCEFEKQSLKNKPADLCGDNLREPAVCCYIGKRRIGDMSKQQCKKTYEYRRIPSEIPSRLIGGGGYNAKAKEYPHMAALGYGEWKTKTWACGGSLISDTIVMTAAHCIDTASGPLKYIRLGDLILHYGDDDANPQDFTVNRTFVHPDYKPPSVYNDIALVELDRPYEATDSGDFIAPACLQTERNITKTNWTAIGWGETSHGGNPADHLQVVELREADHDLCNDGFSNTLKRRLLRGVDRNSQMCAGHEKMDTCRGDSGGPLQVKNDYETGYTVIGITSFGKPCLLTKQPGVYTRVSNYIEWIESIVWPESE